MWLRCLATYKPISSASCLRISMFSFSMCSFRCKSKRWSMTAALQTHKKPQCLNIVYIGNRSFHNSFVRQVLIKHWRLSRYNVILNGLDIAFKSTIPLEVPLASLCHSYSSSNVPWREDYYIEWCGFLQWATSHHIRPYKVNNKMY